MKLVCFPYAGAHVNVFTKLIESINSKNLEIDVISLEYAGHGRRFSEKPYDSIKDNANDLFMRLSNMLEENEPVILLGYSMGAIVAYEVAQLLMNRGFKIKKIIFMAATPPHKIEFTDEDYSSDTALLERCKRYGLIKEDQFSSKEMRNLFLPALRSDIISVNRYNVENEFNYYIFDTNIDIAIFQGKKDTSVSSLESWQELSSGEVNYYVYPSGHFFFYDYQKEVIGDIINFITDKRHSVYL